MQDNKHGNTYQGYGYEQYEIKMNSPRPMQAGEYVRGSNRVMGQKGLGGIMANKKLRTPVLAAGALILAVVGFTALVMNSYPEDPNATVPVVRADKTAFKSVPSDPGGMEIAHSDSTVYDTFRDNSAEGEVENLLRQSGQPMDKLEAFAAQVEQKLKEQEMEREAQMAAMEQEQKSMDYGSDASILQQITPAAGEDASGSEAIAAAKPSEKPKAFHKAGESPDTLEFVRSVLEEKKKAADAPKVAAASQADDMSKAVAAIEPAAGAAVSAGRYTSGLYFVQLASIGDRSRAPGEWMKMQKTHGATLQDVNYRVMKADLGAKGVFYRIQAGPFSKGDAYKVCDSIKQTKPGGCFVVK